MRVVKHHGGHQFDSLAPMMHDLLHQAVNHAVHDALRQYSPAA